MENYFTMPGVVDRRWWHFSHDRVHYYEYAVGSEYTITGESLGAGYPASAVYYGIRVGPKHAGNPYGLKRNREYLLYGIDEGDRIAPPRERRLPLIDIYFTWTYDEIMEKIRNTTSQINPMVPVQGILIVRSWAEMAVVMR